MSYPTVVRQRHTAGNVASSSPETSSALAEADERRPARPGDCSHGHVTPNCPIRFGAWEAKTLPAPPRY